MLTNPYHPTTETSPPARRRRIPVRGLLLSISLVVAMVLVFFGAPRWTVVFPGAVAVWVAESMLERYLRRDA